MKDILLIEDNVAFAQSLKSYFERKGVFLELAYTGNEALQMVENSSYKIILLDLFLPDVAGWKILPQLVKKAALLLVITSGSETSLVVESMKAGAYDFIVKPIDLEILFLKLKNLLDKIPDEDEIPELIGNSEAIRKIKDSIKIVARSSVPILIVGETGVGKELIARAIHRLSGRKGKFISINCASIPENLFESELFGYKKGAFTGATASKAGLFVEANEGTIFLDEVTEMPPHLQAKLLRALEKGEVLPLGGVSPEKSDARVLAATNQTKDYVLKKLRKDFFFRISAVQIEVPPLRERKEDIIPLAYHFLRIYGKEKGITTLSRKVEQLFLNYDWPGNVRELKNEIERAVLFCRKKYLDAEDLSDKFIEKKFEIKTLREKEKEYILQILKLCKNNKSKAAQLLGISRQTLRKKLKE